MSKNAISHLKPGFGVKVSPLRKQKDELEQPGIQVYLMFSLIEPTRQAK